MCDLVLNNEQTLKTHKETHISINCEHCSFKCNSSLKMDDHKKKNHSTSCNLCDFGPDLIDVQVHKREYHNIKGISCKKCSQVCDSAEALNTHISKVHTISQESPRRRPFCKFWNYSICTKGSNCEYMHEEAPYCPHGIECRRGRKCQFFH